MIDFPTNPTVGQTFTAAGCTWMWDGVKWTTGASGVAEGGFLPLTGGALTGPLNLYADPSNDLEAATKEYVDNSSGAVTLSATPPLNAKNGALWWDTVSGSLFVWYNDGTTSQWVAASNGFFTVPGFLPLTGGTLTGGLTGTTATFTGSITVGDGTGYASIAINNKEGSGNNIVGEINGGVRWLIGMGTGEPETGANAGSNFGIYPYADDGVSQLQVAISINRATSDVTFGSGDIWLPQGRGGYAQLGFGPASNPLAYCYYEPSDGSLRMTHVNGEVLTIGTGNAFSNMAFQSSTGYKCKQGTGGGYSNIFNAWWDGAGNTQWWIDATYMGVLTMSSDYRVKKDITPLPSTWSQVKALKPVRYTHKNHGLIKADNKERWGFVAHELQETLIEDAATGRKDAENVIQSPNPWTVIAALTKTLQETMTRVETLEAARGT